MTPGDVIVLTKQERLEWRGGARRRGNSNMGHTCRCWRRPFEAKVCEQTPAGPRFIHTCLRCAKKIAKKYGKELVAV